MQRLPFRVYADRNIAERKVKARIFKRFIEPRNRFQGMNSARLWSLAGRYDNPILTRFLAPIDCLRIPAQVRGDAEAARDEASHTKDGFQRLFR